MKVKGVLGVLVGTGAWLFAPVPVFAQDDAPPTEQPGWEEPATVEPGAEPGGTYETYEPGTADPATVGPMDNDIAPAPMVVGEDDMEVRGAAFTPRTGYGVAVSLGGGVTNFTAQEARDVTGIGGEWTLRLSLGTRSILGVEAAYFGGAHGLAAVGLDEDAYLLRNGTEGVVRLNAPITRGQWLVVPYAFGGAGWTRYDLMNSDFNTSAVQSEDNVFTVPVGAGIGASYRGFMVDSRFTYRAAFNEDMLGGASLDTWGVTANIGREF